MIVAGIGLTALIMKNERNLVRKIAPADADAAARRYIALLAARRFSPIERDVDASLKNAKLRGELGGAAAPLQTGTIVSIDMTGAQQNLGNERPPIVLGYEVKLTRGVAAVTVAFKREGTRLVIEELSVYRLDQPLERANAFTLTGKSLAQYLWLLAASAVMVFVLTTLLVCMWETRVRWRWLWAVLCCAGVAKCTMDWATGETDIQPISFQMPGAAIWPSSFYGHWYVLFTLPLGAILFWLFRARLVAPKEKSRDLEAGPLPVAD